MSGVGKKVSVLRRTRGGLYAPLGGWQPPAAANLAIAQGAAPPAAVTLLPSRVSRPMEREPRVESTQHVRMCDPLCISFSTL